MGKSLEEIFTGDEPTEAGIPAVVETAESAVETPETPVVEQAAEPTVEQPEVPAEEPEKPESKTVPIDAVHEERAKRRDLEKRYNALTEQVGQLLPHLSKIGQKGETAEQPKLDFYADPQAFLTQNLSDLESRINTSLGSTLMAMSEAQGRARHEDFDETLGQFAELTKSQPHIRQQLRQEPDPAEWAYNFAKRAEMIADIGDNPTAYEAKIRAKLEAEQVETKAPDPNLPKSLATVRNVGAGKRTSGPGWQGPTSLDAALAGAPGRAKK